MSEYVIERKAIPIMFHSLSLLVPPTYERGVSCPFLLLLFVAGDSEVVDLPDSDWPWLACGGRIVVVMKIEMLDKKHEVVLKKEDIEKN